MADGGDVVDVNADCYCYDVDDVGEIDDNAECDDEMVHFCTLTLQFFTLQLLF